jgi:hypothetical protein
VHTRKLHRAIILAGLLIAFWPQASFARFASWIIFGDQSSCDAHGEYSTSYTIVSVGGQSCQNEHCLFCDGPDACSPPDAPELRCPRGYCPAEPGYHPGAVCTGTEIVCYDFVNACVKACCEDPGFVDFNYEGGWRNSKTGEIWYPLGPPGGGDDGSDPGDHGHGQEPDPVSLEPCSNSPSDNPAYLPSFDDYLCYTVHAEYHGTVNVALHTSTYEGIAMNAPAPEGLTDTVSDIVPYGNWDSWNICPTDSNHTYFENESWFGDFSVFAAGQTLKVRLHVLDYGPTAQLIASLDGGSPFIAYIPSTYDSVRSAADPDSDGFTTFEEYRGFIVGDGSHIRLTADTAECFYRDGDQLFDSGYVAVLDTMMHAKLIDYGFDAGSNDSSSVLRLWILPGDSAVRKFVDFESREWNAHDTAWVSNALCIPTGMDSLPLDNQSQPIHRAQQGIIEYQEYLHEPPTHFPTVTWGFTSQYLVPAGNDPPHVYRGPGGCEFVRVYRQSIDEAEVSFLDEGLVSSLWPAFEHVRIQRTLAHETGHVQGLGEHWPDISGGSYNCVMKYDNFLPTHRDSAGWHDEWIARGPGAGYGFTDQLGSPDTWDSYQCHQNRGLRPTGPTFP